MSGEAPIVDPKVVKSAPDAEVVSEIPDAAEKVAVVPEGVPVVRVKGEWHWKKHPAFVDEQLTFGQRAADRLRAGMGSWPFVISFFAVMIVWIFLNSSLLLGAHHRKPIDPFPYILLNLSLSMLAGVQGAILLISAKRQDTISSQVAIHTATTADEIKALVTADTDLTTQIEALTRAVHDHLLNGGS